MNRIYILLISIGLVLFCFSCNTSKKATITKNKKMYPELPDTARIQFLTSISSSLDIKYKKQSTFNKYVTGEEERVQSISNPVGINIKNGKLYVADIGVGCVDILDLENETFTYFNVEGKGKMVRPLNSVVDEFGTLYVADGGRREIVVFNKEGNFINSFGKKEDFKPIDLFYYNNKIWVLNVITKKIEIYNKDSHKLLRSFPNVEAGDDGFIYSPKSIYIENDIVYITDFGGFTINKYTINGDYIGCVGGQGQGFGNLARPKGVAADKEGNIFAVDATFSNVQIFNDKGQLLLPFGGHYKEKGDMYLPYGIRIDYENLDYFQKYVDPNYKLLYLILVTNQTGPDKINIYGRVEHKDNINN